MSGFDIPVVSPSKGSTDALNRWKQSEEPISSAPSALEINAEDLETRSQSQKLRSNIQRKIGNSVAPSGYFIRVLVYFIYLAIGAYVFLCLERQNEIELCQAAKNISTLYMKGLIRPEVIVNLETSLRNKIQLETQ